MKKILLACIVGVLMFPTSVLADPYLISPFNGQTVSTDSPAFDWADTDMGYIDNWYIEISRYPYTTSNGFFYSSDLVYAKGNLWPSYLGLALEGYYLTPGTYYWHIDGAYTAGPNAWSGIRSFTVPAPYTPPPPPPAPVPVVVKDTYKPKTYAKGTRSARRKGRSKTATVGLRWYVRDNTSTVYVKLRIQKRVRSRSRVARKARYLKRYRAYRGKYLKYRTKYRRTRNKTLRRRYQRAAVKYKKAMNKYLRAYRKTSVNVYKTVKVPNYRWTSVNKWRTYKWKTRSAGLYRYLVYAKDRANNSQRNVAKAGFRIR